jgi:hypothetical protein
MSNVRQMFTMLEDGAERLTTVESCIRRIMQATDHDQKVRLLRQAQSLVRATHGDLCEIVTHFETGHEVLTSSLDKPPPPPTTTPTPKLPF